MKRIKGTTKVGDLNRRQTIRLAYILLWLGINPDLFRPAGTRKLVFLPDDAFVRDNLIMIRCEFAPDADVITVLLHCLRYVTRLP